MIDSLKKLYSLLDPGNRKKFLLLILFMIFDALLEILGLHLVPAYVGLVAYPERVKLLLPEFWSSYSHQNIVLLASLAIVLFFGSKLLINARIALSRIRFAHSTALDLSTRLLNAYLYAPYEYHLRHNSAELQRNLNNDSVQLAEQVLIPLGDLLSQGVIILAVLAVFLFYIPPTPLSALISTLAVAGYVVLSQQHRLRHEGQEAQRLHGNLIKSANEAFMCTKEIALLGRQPYFIQRYRNIFSRLVLLRQHVQIMGGKLIPGGLELATIAGLAGMIYLLFHNGRNAENVLSLVTIAAVGLARLKGSLSSFMGAHSLLQHKRASLDSIHSDLTALEEKQNQSKSDNKASVFENELQLDSVYYRYPSSNNPVLKGINLTIKPGQAIGFVGKSGAGKSTLIDLIMGLLHPTAGKILLDGRPLIENLAPWQRQIGYVPQLLSLIDGTIRENITLGLPSHEIDEQSLAQAVSQARLDEFIKHLPKGLDTIIGERGIRLSGGQRQRIAIARALYHNPKVIIFDEGTSALDDQTESEIVNTIDSLKGKKTILMIAHRLSTLNSCDFVYAISNGKIYPGTIINGRFIYSTDNFAKTEIQVSS